MQDKINFEPVFNYIDKNNGKLLKLFEQRISQNNDELLEKMENGFATKKDFDRISDTLDHMLRIVHKLDDERLLTVEWIKRIEHELEKVKRHLKIA